MTTSSEPRHSVGPQTGPPRPPPASETPTPDVRAQPDGDRKRKDHPGVAASPPAAKRPRLGDGPEDGATCARDDPQHHATLAHVPVPLPPVALEQSLAPYTGKHGQVGAAAPGDLDKRYCSRHRPGSKYGPGMAGPRMEEMQKELSQLPPGEQQAIAHVWSLFSAAPARNRELMLEGVIAQACSSQLSLVSGLVKQQLKVDFISALPREIGIMILMHLDTVSLCRAAQVSRRWRSLADEDIIWRRMCEQHIDRKCTSCGWGLPLMVNRRAKTWSHGTQPANHAAGADPFMRRNPPRQLPAPNTSKSTLPFKPGCLERTGSEPKPPSPVFRPWKEVYRDRWIVEKNWKRGRYTARSFRAHEGVITTIWEDETANVAITSAKVDAQQWPNIRVWDWDSGDMIREFGPETGDTRTFCVEGCKLFSGGSDSTVCIWNWRTGVRLSTLQAPRTVSALHFGGDCLVAGGDGGFIRCWNFATNEYWTLGRNIGTSINHVHVDAASRTFFILAEGGDAAVYLVDLDSRAILRTYDGHTGAIKGFCTLPHEYEPDEPTLAGLVRNYNPREERHLKTSRDLASVVAARLAIDQPDHTSADFDRAMYGESFEQQPARPLPPRHFLTSSVDSTIKLWDSVTGTPLSTWFGHFGPVCRMAGGNLRVASCSVDALVKIWDPRTGSCVRTHFTHDRPVTAIHLSDSRLVSGDADGIVRLQCFRHAASCPQGEHV